MAFNERQTSFIRYIQNIASNGEYMYAAKKYINQIFNEDFIDGKQFSINDDQQLIQSYGINYDSIEKFVNRTCLEYVNYWDDLPLTQREHGKFARKIISNYRVNF
jgi:hypothetical protein